MRRRRSWARTVSCSTVRRSRSRRATPTSRRQASASRRVLRAIPKAARCGRSGVGSSSQARTPSRCFSPRRPTLRDSGVREALRRSRIAAAARKPFDGCARTTSPTTSGSSAASTLDLGATDAAQTADRRAARERRSAAPIDPQLVALYFQFGRYLLISSSRPGTHAGEPAGHLERLARAAVGQQVHDQHQHRDELLAGGGRRTSPSCTSRCSIWSTARARTAGASRRTLYGARGFVMHHNTDLWGHAVPIDQRALRHVADGRRVAEPAFLGSLRLHARPRVPARRARIR